LFVLVPMNQNTSRTSHCPDTELHSISNETAPLTSRFPMHGPNCLTAEAPGSSLGRLGRVSALTWQASCSPAVLGGAEGSALARRACPRPDGPAQGPAGQPGPGGPAPGPLRPGSSARLSKALPGRNAFLHESACYIRLPDPEPNSQSQQRVRRRGLPPQK